MPFSARPTPCSTTRRSALEAAGVALDAWEEIEPLQHSAWLGPMLVAALLRGRGKTRHHLSALHAGFRHAKYRRSRQSDLKSRLTAFAHAVEVMATADSKKLDRLTLAREFLHRKYKECRTNSRLPRLVDRVWLRRSSPSLSSPRNSECRASRDHDDRRTLVEPSRVDWTTAIQGLGCYMKERPGAGRLEASI